MKHFTDYRCFHFCHREVTLNGVTRAVGVCECKPDALSPVWGDTRCRPGLQVCLASLWFRSFKTKNALHQCFMDCNFFFPGAIVPIMRDPHQILDYDNWWKKELHNITPNDVPPVTIDLIGKMEVHL